jgi:hypothetical protein
VNPKIDIELVLVHLGTRIPSVLKANLKYIQQKFPELKITIVVDEKSNSEWLRRRGIDTHLYVDNYGIAELFESHSYSREFRQGFWQTSTKRIFAFLEYFDSNPSGPKIHIENDILLLQNFPFQVFANFDKIAWLSYNQARDVGALMFCPSTEEAHWLASKLLENMKVDDNFTDMTLLRDVSTKHPSNIAKLPIAESAESSLFAENVPLGERQINSQNYSIFNGVFDAAPIGMWVSGQDPRNHRGRQLLHVNHQDSYIQPGQVSFKFTESLISVQTEKNVLLYNLHVHSKELPMFSKREQLVKKYVSWTRDQRLITRFKPVVFAKLLWKRLMKVM